MKTEKIPVKGRKTLKLNNDREIIFYFEGRKHVVRKDRTKDYRDLVSEIQENEGKLETDRTFFYRGKLKKVAFVELKEDYSKEMLKKL